MRDAARPRPQDRAEEEFAQSVLDGLGRAQKRLEAKHLYDEEGSRLFDRICDLDEYYPTRTEMRILRANAHRLSSLLPRGTAMVELGSGSSVKTRLVLEAVPEIAAYVPLDISAEHLASATDRIAADYPALEVRPVVADFTRPIALPETLASRPKLLFFPGSTIGNFTMPEARALLTRLRRVPNVAAFVIGADLVKDAGTLVAAYDDAEGVTAAFNRNLLVRMNRELDADFALDGFGHEARWNAAQSRIEMHLVSRRPQVARVAGQRVTFAEGETIHTESSHKFTLDGFRDLALSGGWETREVWTDARDLFSLHVLTPG